ncbi:Uncharacterized protein TCM_025695 [Theobroma cacao]|uniref:Defensin-like protein n=1 Tax=Theobroma cacao TaxID=3641 RepID=A0A061F097_THECC|nr:Uncharacterized protein TCM_025695 [Theobroma cacao]
MEKVHILEETNWKIRMSNKNVLASVKFGKNNELTGYYSFVYKVYICWIKTASLLPTCVIYKCKRLWVSNTLQIIEEEQKGKGRITAMKNLGVSVIFILALLFTVGNEVKAQDQGKVCAVPFGLPNCKDATCNSSCQRKFPPNGNGMCQGGVTCLCFHPC